MHYINHTVANGSYDVDYIEAVFLGDNSEVARIEEDARELGYGPLSTCSTVLNHSSQRLICRAFIPIPFFIFFLLTIS